MRICMKILGWISGILFLLTFYVLGQDIPQEEDYRLIQEKWYVLEVAGKFQGYWHLVEKRSAHKLAPLLFIYDVRGKEEDSDAFKIKYFCQNDAFCRPIKIIYQSPDIQEAFTCTVQDNKLNKISPEGEAQIEFLPRTTIAPLHFEIIQQLPFQKNEPFKFHILLIGKMSIEENQQVTYEGQEELILDGEKHKLHKFKHTNVGDRTCFYWVDDKRTLKRMIDGKTCVYLTSEENAKRLEQLAREEPKETEAETKGTEPEKSSQE